MEAHDENTLMAVADWQRCCGPDPEDHSRRSDLATEQRSN